MFFRGWGPVSYTHLRQGLIDSDVMVHMPGGKLWTQIDEEWNVKMIGSVKRICKIELFEDFFH